MLPFQGTQVSVNIKDIVILMKLRRGLGPEPRRLESAIYFRYILRVVPISIIPKRVLINIVNVCRILRSAPTIGAGRAREDEAAGG